MPPSHLMMPSTNSRIAGILLTAAGRCSVPRLGSQHRQGTQAERHHGGDTRPGLQLLHPPMGSYPSAKVTHCRAVQLVTKRRPMGCVAAVVLVCCDTAAGPMQYHTASSHGSKFASSSVQVVKCGEGAQLKFEESPAACVNVVVVASQLGW